MTASTTPPAHIADLQHLITRDPGRPRVTWYGDDSERVELSGAVLHNWVSKTVNLLVEEFDAAPGSRVLLDLPTHWRAIVWALATWRTGATLVVLPETAATDGVGQEGGATRTAPEDNGATGHGLPQGMGPVDVVVTSRPAFWEGHDAPLVAVPLPALARRFDGTLPAGAIDAGSAVMTYGDQIGWVEEVDLDAVAIAPDVAHRDLTGWALEAAPRPSLSGPRVHVDDEPLLTSLRRTLQALALDGSVVVTSPSVTSALASDPERAARLRESERVTG